MRKTNPRKLDPLCWAKVDQHPPAHHARWMVCMWTEYNVRGQENTVPLYSCPTLCTEPFTSIYYGSCREGSHMSAFS